MTTVNDIPMDLVGNQIFVGSRVASMVKDYRSLVIAKVIKITAQTILVEYNNTWNYGSKGRVQTYRVPFNAVVVLDDKN